METVTQHLVLKGFGGVPEITPDAFTLKKDAIEASKKIKRVTTEEEQQVAVVAMRALKGIRTGMETTRKAVKAPVIELGKKIDTVAADFMQEPDKEEARLQGLINHYQKQVLAEQRKEQERLEHEAQVARDLEEAARKKREEADAAINEEDRNKAAAEAKELENKSFEATMASELNAGQPIVTTKLKGLVVKVRLNFEIEDAHVFMQGYPEFWTWHAETETLKLKRREILEELNREDGKGRFHMTRFPEELPAEKGSALVRPAGMRVFEDLKSHVR